MANEGDGEVDKKVFYDFIRFYEVVSNVIRYLRQGVWCTYMFSKIVRAHGVPYNLLWNTAYRGTGKNGISGKRW